MVVRNFFFFHFWVFEVRRFCNPTNKISVALLLSIEHFGLLTGSELQLSFAGSVSFWEDENQQTEAGTKSRAS
jgi:hypothetical protein